MDRETVGPGEGKEGGTPRGSGTVEHILAANRQYAESFSEAGLSVKPARRLIVITCMDSRLAILRAMGLSLGDAHMIRTAGAGVGPDVIASVAMSRERAGTGEIVLVGHTDCAAYRGDDVATEQGIREGLARLREVEPAMEVTAMMYDVDTGSLRLLDA